MGTYLKSFELIHLYFSSSEGIKYRVLLCKVNGGPDFPFSLHWAGQSVEQSTEQEKLCDVKGHVLSALLCHRNMDTPAQALRVYPFSLFCACLDLRLLCFIHLQGSVSTEWKESSRASQRLGRIGPLRHCLPWWRANQGRDKLYEHWKESTFKKRMGQTFFFFFLFESSITLNQWSIGC